MAKIKEVPIDSLGNIQYQYWCEGCGKEHAFELLPNGSHAFNGDFNNPVISPSIVNKNPHCHCMIYNGRIRYFKDCNHSLAGKDVELLDVDEMVSKRRVALN